MNTKKLLSFSAGTLLTIGIVIAVNIAAAPLTLRLDLTNDRTFSLSEPTKELLSSLDDTVQIKAYMTNDLPSETMDVKQYIESMLREYKAYGHSKIQIDFIDPTTPEKEGEAQEAGLFPLQFNKMENDSFVAKKGYLGLAMRYGSKKEVIPQLTKTEGLEYDLTSSLQKLTAKTIPTITVVGGLGTPDMAFDQSKQKTIERLVTMLKKTYTVTSWDASGTAPFPENSSAIMITGITSDFSEATVATLQKQIDKGTHLFIAQNYIEIDSSKGISAKELKLPVFEKFLKDNGMSISKGLVADESNQRITVSSQQGMFTMQQLVQFPLFPIMKDALNTPISESISPLSLPFVTEVTFEPKNEKDMVFAQSSAQSSLYTQTTFPITTPAAFFTGTKQKYTLGIAREKGTSRQVLLGSSECLLDQMRNDSCVNIILNSIDWTMKDARLIAVRTKGFKTYLLKNTSNEDKMFLRGMILSIPSLIVICGGLIYAYRRSRKASKSYLK